MILDHFYGRCIHQKQHIRMMDTQYGILHFLIVLKIFDNQAGIDPAFFPV